MNLTPLQRRAARRSRNQTQLDMNLVSLIDIFTILIFFLLSNTSAVEILPNSKAVKLPESTAEKAPRDTLVIIVNEQEIVVDGRKIVAVADILNTEADLIEPLKVELDRQSGRRAVREENAKPEKSITIMGDRAIPYRLLRKVMVTCARAEYSDVSFAVRQKAES